METAPNRPSSRRWFTASVLGFGLASLLSDAGHEAATSALPALLVSMGAAPAALGIIEGIADGLASFAKLGGGWLADRPHLRKPIAVLGYFITGLSTGAYGLAGGWGHLLAARSVGWLARGMRGPARDAMLADAVPPEVRGRAFGFHRAMDSMGAVLGPLLSMALLASAPLRGVFAWTMVPGVLAALATAIKLANLRVFERSTSDPKCRGMGTTIVASSFTPEKQTIAHAGDSRVYHFVTAEQRLVQVTEDHSLLNDYIRAGKLTPEEIANFPHKNVIVRALGIKETVEVDIARPKLAPGDIVLLCCDGLSGMVTDPAMADILSKQPDLDRAATQLVDAANAGGGVDNITVILVRWNP